MFGGLPVEMITMLGSSVLGGVMSIWAQSIKAKQEEQKMLLARAETQMSFVEKARTYENKGFQFTRRIIALTAVFFYYSMAQVSAGVIQYSSDINMDRVYSRILILDREERSIDGQRVLRFSDNTTRYTSNVCYCGTILWWKFGEEVMSFKEEKLKTKETDIVLKSIDNLKDSSAQTDFSMNQSKKKVINEVFDKIAEIESDFDRNASNPKSTAKGYFQFIDAGLETAANRYENLTGSKPQWLQNALDNKDPRLLDYDQSKALAIANIAMASGPTIADMNRIAESGQVMGSIDVYNLYKDYHHTETKDNPISSKAVSNAFRKLGINMTSTDLLNRGR